MNWLMYGYGCTVAWNLVARYFSLKRIRETLGDKMPMWQLVGIDGVVRSLIPIFNIFEAIEFTMPLLLNDEQFKNTLEAMISLMEVDDED